MKLTQRIAREFWDYSPRTGRLRWKYRNRKWFLSDSSWKKWNVQYPGKLITTLNPYGYYRVRVFNQGYLVHRIAFLWMIGRWPHPECDHKNRKRDDNRWINLREVTRSQNAVNRGTHRNNKLGIKGVCCWSQDQRYHAYFRRKHLGSYRNLTSAIKARKFAEREWSIL